MSKIILAKHAGFCYGVDRAVNMVYDLLEQGTSVCTLGPIIHNPQLVESLSQRGVDIVNTPAEVPAGRTLVLRSHGVAQSVVDQAAELGLTVADATCPFVAKIHKIAARAAAEGCTLLVAGDKDHKEVEGIVGHCSGPCFVFKDDAELEKLFENEQVLVNSPIYVVAQTTFHAILWKKCQKFLKKVCTNAKIFDTICNATSNRQSEAEVLAKQCNAMVVIGGRHSSNTAKLRQVCAQHCSKTVLVETAAELDLSALLPAETIGVVAGASTPAGIIKEVIKTMSEIINSTEVVEKVEKSFEEMSFEEALEASLNSLNRDQKVKGVVLSVNPTEIEVDIGRKHTGYVPADEFSNDPSVKLVDAVKPGDVLDLIVMRTNDQEGIVTLSKKRFDAIAGWDNVVKAKESGDVLSGTVTEVIKGGVIVNCEGIRVFVPASQATANRGDALEDLKGQTVSFRIIEIGRGRRAVGSIRSVLRDQKREAAQKFWESELTVGDKYTGTVKSLTGYGAFVDIGGVDGMVHISELSWERIKNPSEVVAVGDTIEVYIKAVDVEKKKISLGYKKADDNPWEIFKRDYSIGDTAKAKIISMTAYGAFARLLPGLDGLIHISQIANRRIEKPQDELSIGQEVDVKITDVDYDKKRISLSIRALLEPVAEEAVEAPAEEAPAEEAPAADAE